MVLDPALCDEMSTLRQAGRKKFRAPESGKVPKTAFVHHVQWIHVDECPSTAAHRRGRQLFPIEQTVVESYLAELLAVHKRGLRG